MSQKSETDPRPEVNIRRGRIDETADYAEAALLKAGQPLYNRGGVLVRLVEGVRTPGVKRAPDAPSLVAVSPAAMLEAFEASARFISTVKLRDGSFEPRVVSCPPSLPGVYLARAGRWRVPRVRALSHVPLLKADGSVVYRGYDAESEAVVCGCDAWPKLDAKPTREKAEAAVQQLDPLIDGFSFETPVDRSVMYAAMLSAVLRPSLPSCPGFGFTAPVRGSGKSKLADLCAVLATGRAAAAISWPPREDEAEKRLGAALLAGDPVVLLDNLETSLKSAALNSALTQAEVAVRILGRSEMPRIPAVMLLVVSGNNLQISGDLTRRFLLCHLDPQTERPELRQFAFEPVAWARERRLELVNGLLAIARWGAGQKSTAAPLGSFETWSRRVRDPLLALGFPDPCRSLDTLHVEDPEREQAISVLREWYRVFGPEPTTVALAIREAGTDELLRDALDAIAGGPGGLAPKRLGRWMLRNKGRMYAGKRISRCQDVVNNAAAWAVEAVSGA